MRSILLVFAVLVLLGCPSGDNNGSPFSVGDDPTDDDDGAPDNGWENLPPEGSVQGVVINAGTAGVRIGATATELGSDPENSDNTDGDGAFLLYPGSFEPAQITITGGGYIEAMVALTEASYLGIGERLTIDTWMPDAGMEWAQQQIGQSWDPEFGAVFLVFDAPDGVGAGLSASLDPAAGAGPFVWSAEDEPLEADEIPEGAGRPWIALMEVEAGPITIDVQRPEGLECRFPEQVTARANAMLWVPVWCFSK